MLKRHSLLGSNLMSNYLDIGHELMRNNTHKKISLDFLKNEVKK